MGPTLIGEDRGRERWESMRRTATLLDPVLHRYRVDLAAQPSAREGDIDMDSEEHRKWNLRTLLLLARARCLELDWSRPTDGGPIDAEGSPPDTVVVQMLQPYDADAWWRAAEDVRGRVLEPARETVGQLRRLVSGDDCVADVLRDCYRSDDPDVPVVLACGGCRCCRGKGLSPWSGALRSRHTPGDPWASHSVGERLREFLGGRPAGVIFYRRQRDEPSLPAVVRWLVEQGVTCLSAATDLVAELDGWFQANPGVAVFTDAFPPRGALARQPAAAVVGPGGLPLEDVWPHLHTRDCVTVAVLPDDSAQPDHPTRRLTDMWTGPQLDLALWKDRYEE
jgi:hypothetical protein